MASFHAGEEKEQAKPFFEQIAKTERKKPGSKFLQKGMYFSGYILFVGGILLFLWLGGTSDFPSPSSSALSPGKKRNELSQNSSAQKKIVYSNKGPQLTLEEESYNFGKISQEKEVGHTIKFTNTGNEDLIIHNIDSS